MTATAIAEGHVYVLTSPQSPFIKIGGTTHAPLKRIREINACEPYKSLGPGPCTISGKSPTGAAWNTECTTHCAANSYKPSQGKRSFSKRPPAKFLLI